VNLTIDSLGDWNVQGQVSYIAPASEVVNGVVTYPVRVSFPDTDSRVKVGMTTNLSVITARKENVLLVPNSALLPKDAGRVVQFPSMDGKEPREVDVQVGLTDGVQTEITNGLNEGDRILGAPQPKRRGGGMIEVR
jgi:HlyD family secretion protein